MHLAEQILSIIAPHQCLGCGEEGAVLCRRCVFALPTLPSRCYRCGALTADWRVCLSCHKAAGLTHVWMATDYDGAAQAAVHILKFGRAQAAAADMAFAAARRFDLPADAVITHVPTAPVRARQRGYDQARLLARELARQTGLPYRPMLARLGRARQVGADRQARFDQLRGAFRAIGSRAAASHVIIVDDVLTTGATVEAAARVLREAGASRVSALVFARA